MRQLYICTDMNGTEPIVGNTHVICNTHAHIHCLIQLVHVSIYYISSLGELVCSV